MEQRVNIQYSIDIEELPREVCRLLNKSSETIRDISEKEMSSLTSLETSKVLSIQTLDAIESVRKKLAAADYILNDATNIINGFISYRVAPPKETAPQPDLPPLPPELSNSEGISNEAIMADLKSKIESFKSAHNSKGTST